MTNHVDHETAALKWCSLNGYDFVRVDKRKQRTYYRMGPILTYLPCDEVYDLLAETGIFEELFD